MSSPCKAEGVETAAGQGFEALLSRCAVQYFWLICRGRIESWNASTIGEGDPNPCPRPFMLVCMLKILSTGHVSVWHFQKAM